MFSPAFLVYLPLAVSALSVPLGLDNSTASSLPDDSVGTKNGMICGNFATGSKNDVVFMLHDFQRRFPNDSEDTCGAPGLTCTRQACRNTSGLYDNADQIDVQCAAVADWLEDVTNGCCTTSVLQSKGLSGQQFSTAGWNVVVAYADCNDDPNADRPASFVSWGPNGQCLDHDD